MLLVEAGVEPLGRIDDAPESLGALDEYRMRFQGVVSKRQVATVPLDQAERHIDNRKLARSGLKLARAH
jgi:hypothetical protein